MRMPGMLFVMCALAVGDARPDCGSLQELDASLKALESGEEAARLGEIERRHAEMVAQRDRMRLYVLQ